MNVIFLMVSLMASIIGSICGIGGGVIIKPVLDATGVMGVSSISFLSGCMVLAMAMISVYKSMKRDASIVDLRLGTPLAIGAAVGGVLGKDIFQYAYAILPNEDKVGTIQAIVLTVITLGALTYTIFSSKIKTHHVKNIFAGVVIGLLLGLISAFLGIGGGPINLVVLAYFFSMDTKYAAANSLYIILFSQSTSLVSTIIKGKVPDYNVVVLILMVLGGVFGGMIGSIICKRISSSQVSKLFIGLMIIIVYINVYNAVKFSM